MNRGFMGDVFGARAGRPTIMVRAGGFRAFGTGAYFAAPGIGPMMSEPPEFKEGQINLGRGGGGGHGGGHGGFRGHVPGRPYGQVWNGSYYENIDCGPDYWGPECEIPHAIGSRTRRHTMGAFEGMSIDASIPDLCVLLKKATVSPKIGTAQWNDFWNAVDRLRPMDQSAGQWRANALNQMATQCPDDVERARSMQPTITEKCVKVTIQKSPNQVISTVVEPYQVRGWRIVSVPIAPTLEPELQAGAKMAAPQYEIWACPPGEQLPKQTSLSAREAAELGHSISEALAPIQSGSPAFASCVQDAHVEIAVVNRLMTDLETKAAANETVDVTQDQLDAVKKVIDCASKAGATVTPMPAAAAAAVTPAQGFPWLPVAAVGGAGALALLVF